jgi:DNA polymerase bacteriophage-type
MAAVTLHLDFETRSRTDLSERGLDNYCADPSTQVLMLAWAVNDALPQVWFPADGAMPEELELMIRRVHKTAFNAEFERTILKRILHIDTPVRAWSDPMIFARHASIAGDLAFVGEVLGVAEDKKKSAEGRRLIKLFCLPATRKKKDPPGMPEFNDKTTHPEDWARFVEYCRQDVIAERELFYKLRAFTLPPEEQEMFELDQIINERGLPIDMDFVNKASQIVKEEFDDLWAQMVSLTGLENPNSPKQLLTWLKTSKSGDAADAYQYNSLGARWVRKALADYCHPEVRKALELRQKLAKSSTAKLAALQDLVSADGRLRGQYVYGGAARTMRWSGRGFQPQNLPRPTIKKIPEATEAILTGRREEVAKFGSVLEVVASCLRGAVYV